MHPNDSPNEPGEGAPRPLTDTEFLLARARLGRGFRNRREELRVRVREIASRVGWTTQFYGEIEKGTKSSDDIRAWIQLADVLQLDRIRLLEQVWMTRRGLSIALPNKHDARRDALLRLAISLHAQDELNPLAKSGELIDQPHASSIKKA